jgi:hypothetical protein
MRALILPASALACLVGCRQSTTPDADAVDTVGPVEMREVMSHPYGADALHLTVRELQKGRAPAEQAIEIPPGLLSELFRALAAVYDAAGMPARDSVIELYQVHAHPEPQELLVAVDSTTPWVRAWSRGERLTGNAAVDALLEEYGLALERYYPWHHSHTALLATTRPLNVVALATRFAGIDGIAHATPNRRMGDGDDITAERSGGGWRLEYSVGWGDCIAGCIHRRMWSFFVAADGAVTYLGVRGSPPPSPHDRST